MPPAKWDDARHKQLLLAVIHLSTISTPNWDKVAAAMNEGCTGSAVRQQFNFLKIKAKEEFGEAGDVGAGDGAKPKAGASAGKGRAKKATGEVTVKSGLKRKADKMAEDDAEGVGGVEGKHESTKRVKEEEDQI
ncbi:hypothetical protein CB0940_09715 [Cercospora beticola]|uniref:Myb-like domain-containing protein n=1 Tax=Cercospora beticola TaxID=122368 RepID=A0A2G5HFY5_CERBT|nr:hypothetical protein CB0940_09715 [Cercospora beticola]PIA91439.1 hypothetical protein CB0940_09715 [Cercospora beticola]WPB05945.1 hypothetical protein RHO25_010600 [Cercospora beticola]CAK1365818.1 unnamed protein product [Cercospora beticola]